jgi:hypothetical protein
VAEITDEVFSDRFETPLSPFVVEVGCMFQGDLNPFSSMDLPWLLAKDPGIPDSGSPDQDTVHTRLSDPVPGLFERRNIPVSQDERPASIGDTNGRGNRIPGSRSLVHLF